MKCKLLIDLRIFLLKPIVQLTVIYEGPHVELLEILHIDKIAVQ